MKSVGIVEEKDFSIEGNFDLVSGEKLKDVNIRYESYGKLNRDRSNGILITHPLTATAHAAGYHREGDRKPGWWDNIIGPGKAIDSDRYFIVCSNVIGGCAGSTGPRSINPKTGRIYNLDFPIITIEDMVNAQHRLMEHLGIERWLSIIGGSMGGMQAIQWALEYPDCVKTVIPIATSYNQSPEAIAFNWVGREAIMRDPNWNRGNYTDGAKISGLAIARMLGHITYLSKQSMNRKFGRRIRIDEKESYGFGKKFEVESYLDYQGYNFSGRFDPNSYLYLTRAIDYFDITAKYNGNLVMALSKVSSRFLIISFSSDWLYPPEESKKMVNALLQTDKEVSYCNIESSYGHDAFLLEFESLGRLINGFLASEGV